MYRWWISSTMYWVCIFKNKPREIVMSSSLIYMNSDRRRAGKFLLSPSPHFVSKIHKSLITLPESILGEKMDFGGQLRTIFLNAIAKFDQYVRKCYPDFWYEALFSLEDNCLYFKYRYLVCINKYFYLCFDK